MFEMADSGQLYYEKAVNGFLGMMCRRICILRIFCSVELSPGGRNRAGVPFIPYAITRASSANQ